MRGRASRRSFPHARARGALGRARRGRTALRSRGVARRLVVPGIGYRAPVASLTSTARTGGCFPSRAYARASSARLHERPLGGRYGRGGGRCARRTRGSGRGGGLARGFRHAARRLRPHAALRAHFSLARYGSLNPENGAHGGGLRGASRRRLYGGGCHVRARRTEPFCPRGSRAQSRSVRATARRTTRIARRRILRG